MNPFPYLEKWIREHGSAATLREHVALLKSQMAALQLVITGLKEENAALKKDCADFKAQSEKLQSQLGEARQEVEHFKQRPAAPAVNWGARPRLKGRMEL